MALAMFSTRSIVTGLRVKPFEEEGSEYKLWKKINSSKLRREGSNRNNKLGSGSKGKTHSLGELSWCAFCLLRSVF